VIDAGEVVLWFRQSRRHRWQALARCATDREALALMRASGKSNGDWMLVEDGSDPNETKPRAVR
jgi:hypothetical protein